MNMQSPSLPLSLIHRVRPPTHGAADKAPLLLLLHGYGSNEDDLMGLAPYVDERFFVVSARAPLTLASGAYAWFPLTFTAQGPTADRADAERSRVLLERFLPELIQAYPVDPARVFLLGFSQGALLSLGLALARPRELAGAVALSGPLPEAWIPTDTMPLTDLPLLVSHGIYDDVVPVANGRAIRAALQNLPVRLTYREYPMGHEISAQSLTDTADWLRDRLDDASVKGELY